MRKAIGLGLACSVFLLTGCLFHRSAHPSAPKAPTVAKPAAPVKPVIKPDLRIAGHIVMVNAEARYVIVTFPPGGVPAAGQHMNLFRNGFKVGEIKITGPQRDNDTAADIVTGDAQLHDEARSDNAAGQP